MRESRQANMENKQCDICGAASYSEFLVTCFHCEQACEHIYCMRKNLKYVPEVWFCEACRPKKKSTLKAKNSPLKIGSPLQKHIAAEEAIKLTTKRTPPPSTTAPSKCFLQKQNTPPKKGALRTQPPCCNRPPNPKPSLGEKLNLHKVDVKNASAESYERPSCASSPCTESLSTRNSGGASLTNLQDQKSVQEKDLAVFSLRFEDDHENLPALGCTWKGSFEIVNMSSSSQFYDGFRAHPPGKVSRKAHDFSKKMPGILQFRLQNHSDVWAEVFDSYSPAGSDIALYFLPGYFERSVQVYNTLYKHLEINDFALRSCLEGVELLIFTSKKLPLDSRINMEFYLWGVFRRMKGNNVLHQNPADVPLSSSLFLPVQGYDSHSLKYDSKDNPEVVDMDIDMIGGKDVGRVDIVRPMLLMGGRHRLHIPQGTDVQFQLQGYNSHSLKCDSKDNPEVVDMDIDMIGGKDVGRVDIFRPMLLLGGRQRLHIRQGNDVRFQLKSQPPFLSHSNVIYKTMDGSCRGGDGSTSGVCGSSDCVDEPPLNVIPCPRPCRPNEIDQIPEQFLEVKREAYPDVPPGFSRLVISRTASDRLLKKPQKETYPDVPPGFSRQGISGTASDRLNVDVGALQVGKEGRLARQLATEASHGESLVTPQALPQLTRADHKDLDAPPGFSGPVIRGLAMRDLFTKITRGSG